MVTVRKISGIKIIRFVIALLALLFILLFCFYKLNLKSVNKLKQNVSFEINENDTYISIADKLKKKRLIRSKIAYDIYVKLSGVSKIEPGIYKLDTSMSVKEIVRSLDPNSKVRTSSLKLTFPEGINMRKVATIISSKTKYSKDDLYNLLNDEKYLNELIGKYWFLTEEIKNNDIYYSLEGYLYPDTYEFKLNVELKTIVETILNNTEKKLSTYQNQISSSKYSVHQILTLASVIELEASSNDDRKGVSGVFYNRLNKNMGLESDVTTYYGLKKDMTESIKGHVKDYNAYNTRNTKLYGKLPVGPICNMSVSSIEATLNPTSSNYYYFVADTNQKVYFTKTYSEHQKIIKKLKDNDIWNA